MRVRYIPIEQDVVDRVRGTLRDDHGNGLEVWTADSDGNPCRSCLRLTPAASRLILFAHRPFTTGGPYAETGPVFIHAEPCARYKRTGEFPPDFRARTLTFRAYDTQGRIHDATVADGVDAERILQRLFATDEVAVVHVRNPVWGCYDFRVERA
jgi:Protein of unknown function (DUF1203)